MTDPLPSAIRDEAHLDDLLARPSAADVAFAETLTSDVMVLGAGGKMEPSLARRVTLRQLLACWATHDLAHAAQISRLLTRAFGREVGPWVKYFSLLKDWQAPTA